MPHEYYMHEALEEALSAYEIWEIPVGAVVVYGGKIIARAHNRKEYSQDPTAHAELRALRRAARKLGRWRLSDCTLYCTLEPCVMCAGAMVNARLGRLVYGVADPKAGAAGSIYDIVRSPALNHQVEVEGGVLQKECGELLKLFFANLRRDG